MFGTRLGRVVGALSVVVVMGGCSRWTHHDGDQAAPSPGPAPAPGPGPAPAPGPGPGPGPAPAPGPQGQSPAKTTLPDAALALTQSNHQWVLNTITVDTNAGAEIDAAFTFAPTQGGYMEFGYEEKDEHNCSSAPDFTYTLAIEDTAGGAPQAMKLQDCVEFPGNKTYRVKVRMLNTAGCTGLDLKVGFLQRSNCDKP